MLFNVKHSVLNRIFDPFRGIWQHILNPLIHSTLSGDFKFALFNMCQLTTFVAIGNQTEH